MEFIEQNMRHQYCLQLDCQDKIGCLFKLLEDFEARGVAEA
jgi:hypothetical protein